MSTNSLSHSIHQAIQKSSTSRLEVFCQTQGLQAQEVDAVDDYKVYSNMALILLSGSDLKVIVKIFFNSNNSTSFLKEIYTPKEIDTNGTGVAIDAFKEVLNLIAGHLKIMLENAEMRSEISLPIALRAYDNMFFTENDAQNSSETFWKISTEKDELLFSSSVVLKNNPTCTEIEYVEETAEIEFF